MADDKNKNKAPMVGAAVQTKSKDFDWASVMPAGYEAEGLHDIGGLTPIYASEPAFEEGWAPCIGHLVRLDTIDIGGEKEKDPKQRWRKFVRVQLAVATKGVLGSGENQKIVDVDAEQDILMPLSGNLKNVEELLAALADPDRVFLGVFRVLGKKDIGRPKGQEMWEIDSKLHNKTIARTGRFTLKQGETNAPALTAAGVTNSGVMHDRDGVVIERAQA